RRAPEPAADVGLDRLRVDPLLADAREQDRRRDLPLAEPRHLDTSGEVARRVCDGVVDVLGGHLDLEPDTIAVELLDLRLHLAAIESERVRLALAGEAIAWSGGRRDRDPHAPHAQGLRRRARAARDGRGAARAR